MKSTYFQIIFFAMLSSCTSRKEYLMPYLNLEYTSDRGFPVKSSNSDFTFKASVNISTSVDRIITVSIDSALGNRATLLEVFMLQNGKVKYKQSEFHPKSGFEGFKSRIDSLNLFILNDQPEIDIAFDQPLTLFVIEIKQNDKYNQFRFNTYYPDKAETSAKYERLQKLILNEFHFPIYIK